MKTKCTLGALLLTFQISIAESIKDYDTNSNGFIEHSELEKIISAKTKIPPSYLDLDSDGDISLAEAQNYPEIQAERYGERKQHAIDVLGEARQYSLSKVSEHFKIPLTPKPKKAEKRFKGKLLIREVVEDIDFGTETKKFDKASAATFSFSQNYKGDDVDQWSAKGVLMYPMRLSTPRKTQGGEEIDEFFIPSLTFDYVDNNSATGEGETDSLVYRLGYLRQVGHEQGWYSYWNTNLAYASDTDFSTSLLALELNWEPVIRQTPIGNAYSFNNDQMFLRIRPIAHLEYGYVFDGGSKEALNPYEDQAFGRIGAKLKVEMWTSLSWLERFHFSLEGLHYETFDGDIDSGTIWSTKMSYRLDEKGHLLLQAEYEKGDLPLTQDPSDLLTVGLGVKF